jgi:hypothetical protein
MSFGLPEIIDLLGSLRRVLVQLVDVDSLPEVSDAQKDAQPVFAKANCMGNVIAFPRFQLLQKRKEPTQVFRGTIVTAFVLGLSLSGCEIALPYGTLA